MRHRSSAMRWMLLCLLALGAAAAPSWAEPTNAQEAAAQKAAEEKAIDEKFQQWKVTLSPEQQAWEKTLEECLGSFYLPLYKREKVAGRISAWDYVQDDPALPRVLLIGDSISRGYTLAVRNALKGKANVHRAPENCGGTANGLKKLPIWLNGGKWAVIHFNFGIHDRKAPLDEYEKRLNTITDQLAATGAKLLWASSTPLPADGKDLDDRDMVTRNEVAAKVMKERGIAVDDLYTFIHPRLAELQIPKDCHFSGQGYEVLGAEVARQILSALPAR